MKFAEKFLNMMKLSDADDETEPFDEEYNEVTEEGYDSDEEEEEDDDEPHKPILSLRRKKKEVSDSEEFDGNQGRVIQFHGKEEGESVKVIRAQTFNEAQIVADFLKEGKTIVVNLEGIEIGQAQRIIDFSSGSCYAIDGNLQKVSNFIFIITPSGVEVSGDFQEILNGVDMPSLGNKF